MYDHPLISKGGKWVDQPQIGNQEIKEQLRAMIALQTIDDEINGVQAQIDSLDSRTHAEEVHVKQEQAALDKVKQEMDKLLKDRREAETTSKQLQEQASKLKGQLFDVKTNEALRALQSEIAQKKDENSVLEERIIEMMMAEDELKVDLKKAEEALKTAHQALKAAEQVNAQEVQGLEAKKTGFQSQWETAAAKLNHHLLERYVKLREARSGKAMAKVENDVCTGCRMAIPPQMFIELKKYRQFHTCTNCARFLYVDE